MRWALCSVGDPTDPQVWSGTPRNILIGLQDAGVEVVPINVLPPPFIFNLMRDLIAVTQLRRYPGLSLRNRARIGRKAATVHPAFFTLCTIVANIRLLFAGKVEVVLQMGTSYRINHPYVVSYEDMTVAQAMEIPQTDLRWLTDRQKRSRLRTQQKAYARLKLLLYSTQWPANSAIDVYKVPPEKVHVVGIGRNFSPKPAVKKWENPHFLFIAKAWEHKGGPELLEAFSLLKTTHPEAQMRLVGGHPPPCEGSGVISDGLLSPHQPDSAKALQQAWDWATCLVVPSHYEAAGIIFAEACSAGIPSIGSELGGSLYIIGDAGVTVPPRNIPALLAAMENLSIPEHAQLLGMKARARSAEFEWPLVCERIITAVTSFSEL